jgi:hypothetical protein
MIRGCIPGDVQLKRMARMGARSGLEAALCLQLSR